jgi:hypothetical protein
MKYCYLVCVTCTQCLWLTTTSYFIDTGNKAQGKQMRCGFLLKFLFCTNDTVNGIP